jgi:CRISPR system Cascade subunit CasB
MSTHSSSPKETAARLLAHLRRLKEDRGAMADLRCALSPARLPRAWPYLARVGGVGNTRIETVAGLFAHHPEETHAGNLGTTCRQICARKSSFDGRFRRLLACDRDEICERLRPVILAAKAEGIKVNYEELFADLCYWSDKVKARWAGAYWGAPDIEEVVTTSEAMA